VHACASVDHLEEEIILLCTESERVGKTFEHYDKYWQEQAVIWKTIRLEGEDGKTMGIGSEEAGANCKAVIFAHLACIANRRFEEVLRLEKIHRL